MINFHHVSIADKEWITAKLYTAKSRNCECSFGNIFSYSAKYDVFVADYDDCLFVKYIKDGMVSYCTPKGTGNLENSFRAIVEDAESTGSKAYIFGMSGKEAGLFNKMFADRFKAVPNRDSFDYIYNSCDLINLSGKIYQSKRNHISFFKRNYNWTYEKLTYDKIPECLEMSRQWLEIKEQNAQSDDLLYEFDIIKRIFENYEQLGYVGGLIRSDGTVIAYTMGEPLTDDTFCIHIEKAFPEIRGAYPAINQMFAENELSGYAYINREDDVGADNLRKAKLSYHPAFLLEKYEAEIN